MKSDPSRFWIGRNVLPEDVLSNPIRCNGAIIQKKKQRGKQKIICELNTQSFSLLIEEKICTYSVKRKCSIERSTEKHSESVPYPRTVKVLQKSIYGNAC